VRPATTSSSLSNTSANVFWPVASRSLDFMTISLNYAG
jgi:hypothetical protein